MLAHVSLITAPRGLRNNDTKKITQGAEITERKVRLPEARPAAASQRKDRLTTSILSWNAAFHDCDRYTSILALLVQPPISPTCCGPTNSIACAVGNAASKCTTARINPCYERKNAPLSGDYTAMRVWGSPSFGESPQKIWSVGCETSNGC